MKYIELKNITKTFQKKTIIDNIDLDINPGEFVILQGKNGAGKSTLLKIILGLLKPDRGESKLFAQTPDRPSSKNKVGVVLQTVNVPEKITVTELVDLLRSYYPDSPSTKEIIHRVDLQEKQNDWASQLSGGQKQRLYFALALAGKPDLLILDEPTRNLDKSGCDNFWKQVKQCRESGITILMVTNNQSDWQELDNLVTRIITLEEGKITEDKIVVDRVVITEDNEQIDYGNQSFLTQLFSQVGFEVKQWYYDILPVLGLILFSGLITYFLPSNSQLILLIFAGITSLTFAIDKVGSRIAAERIEGWENLLRITPLSPIIYLASKIFVPIIVIMVNLLTITILSILKAGNHISLEEWLNIFSSLFLGTIPFFNFGHYFRLFSKA